MARRLIPPGFFVRPTRSVNRRNGAWAVVLETCDVILCPCRSAHGARILVRRSRARRRRQSRADLAPAAVANLAPMPCPVSACPVSACPVSACPVSACPGPWAVFRAPWPKGPGPQSSPGTAENCQEPPKIGPRSPWRRLRPRSAQITPGKTI